MVLAWEHGAVPRLLVSETTVIRDAAWIVAWDATSERHAYLRDADVAFTDDRIVHVGPGYEGAADVEVDALYSTKFRAHTLGNSNRCTRETRSDAKKSATRSAVSS